MTLRAWGSLLLIFLLAGCSTATEFLTNDDPYSYHKEKDEQGHTKYVRERVISGPSVAPVIPPHPLDPPDKSNYKVDLVPEINLGALPPANSYASALSLGIAANKDVANFDISLEAIGDFLSGGLGFSYVGSDRTYLGFTGSMRAHLPWKISPYAGLGLYGGDSKTCETKTVGFDVVEVCEKYYLFAATADFGIHWKVTDNFHLRLVSRTFTHTRQGDELADTLYGINLMAVF